MLVTAQNWDEPPKDCELVYLQMLCGRYESYSL